MTAVCHQDWFVPLDMVDPVGYYGGGLPYVNGYFTPPALLYSPPRAPLDLRWLPQACATPICPHSP